MSTPVGPGSPFVLLFETGRAAGVSLPEIFRSIYGGDWRIPQQPRRPYVFVNFAVSHDGRISFNEPGHLGAADVNQRNPHDRWLMGLLRARADAVLIGDGTLRAAVAHVWTPDYIFPEDAAAFAALRRREGRTPVPWLVVLSQTGELPANAEVWRERMPVVVVTPRGRGHAVRSMRHRGRVRLLELGADTVDVRQLMAILARQFGVRTLLCEGGARTYGALLRAGCVDEEFLTICPLVIGSGSAGRPRPSLVEGATFMPGAAPRLRLCSIRQAGDYLFLRSQIHRVPRGAGRRTSR
jgi:5-amino-6-(5-phosphoribosylamino)uracil reductase